MTWDQLVDAATKLTKGDTYGYFTPLNHPHHHLVMTRVYGGQLISPDGKTALFNSPESLQGLQFDYDAGPRAQDRAADEGRAVQSARCVRQPGTPPCTRPAPGISRSAR